MKKMMDIVIAFVLASGITSAQNLREKKVRDDRHKIETEGFWIYNDLPKGFAEAKKTGKPMLVVLRCIPCEECVKLDDDLVNQDPIVRPLLDKFVCVRKVSTNGLDLSVFQYDTDQSFAAFILNADGTIYGRFGTRSHRTNWLGDVSVQGLAKALQSGLELHKDYPNNKAALKGKTGPEPKFPTPESIPMLKGKYTSKLNYSGEVVKSCIHCHQIGDGLKAYAREQEEPFPMNLLYPFPHPKSIGLVLNPKERATITSVKPNSLAERALFRAGDNIVSLNGQPLISMADVQWVLHQTPMQGGSITAVVQRDNQPLTLTLKLPTGWRRNDDISWRSSTWGLRRMTTGGMVLEALEPLEQPGGVPVGGMALKVKHVGQYGPHAIAKQAGFRIDDVIISFDGMTELIRESDVMEHVLLRNRPGTKVDVVVLRNGRKVTLQLPMQK